MALIDDVTIRIKAGDGGHGGHSFHTNYGNIKSHADGGNGGRGGDVYFEGTSNLNDLSEFRFRKEITAPDGEPGMNKNLDGKKGESVTILVPLGTSIINTANSETIEILEKGQRELLAQGGRGQTGNHDQRFDIKKIYKKPIEDQFGEEKELHLILSLIADIGLIGLPNAGKSSLLKTLTAADPKIGNYPFTTLEPNLGVMKIEEMEEGKQTTDDRSKMMEEENTDEARDTSGTLDTHDSRIVLADIPGLVAGASLGKGLGFTFLKHIQKTKVLIHCIDASAPNPYETYQIVRKEFEDYDRSLLEKKEVILLTKIDLVEPVVLKAQIEELKKTKREIITTSIYQEDKIEELKKILIKVSEATKSY